ncbi:MAG: prephenate dehydrogenase/arogenate dehydrogenase family protein [Oscillibacter sp.]|nr:prephenate dehydrogenase/arogenate dehydrogenase family protein [Oscillibacter sp.]
MTVGIVGLGLIGGSMAKSAKDRTGHTVYGIDAEAEIMTLARMSGAIDGPLNEHNLPWCDLILLAIRPADAVKWVEENARMIAAKAMVVDLCGVKRNVCAAIAPIARRRGFTYIGGHPMAGRERSGFTASSQDLFVDAHMILTPDERTDASHIEKLRNFFTDIGFAGLTLSTPDEHDRIVAYTSQLAHVVSSAYVKSPTAEKRRGFSAGSFRDMTRVARLDENMWAELFLENADYLGKELDILIGNLQQYAKAIEDRDADALRALLKDGREKKAAVGGN